MFHANFTCFYVIFLMFHDLFNNILSQEVSRETLSCGYEYIYYYVSRETSYNWISSA